MSIIYGPVPSWRLGRSLGIDLLPGRGKTCTFDCIYCQLGRTTCFTSARQVFVPTKQLEAELAVLPSIEVDYVTFSGTGEPTLAANLGEALDLVSRWPALRGVPIAVLTNATLLSNSEVRRSLATANTIVAKLDAPDQALFHAINRPVAGCSWRDVVEGLQTLRQEFTGRLALQMMFIAALQSRAAEMADLARKLNADEVQLNTPLRPSLTSPLSQKEMAEIETAFIVLPAISVYAARPPSTRPLDNAETRSRRPAEAHPETIKRDVDKCSSG